MRRREFILALGGAAAAPMFWSLAARAQQAGQMRRIGVLVPQPERDTDAQAEVTTFRDRLSQLGWTDGRNLRIDYRWATGDIGRIRTAAKELVALHPDAIFVRTTPGTAALLAETRMIPIVFVNVADPIGSGFVASMARPGGNVTGFTNVETSLGGKYVELLTEISPKLGRVGLVYNPTTAPYAKLFLDSAIRAASAFKIAIVPIHAQNAAEIESAIESFARELNGGLAFIPDVTATTHRALIIALATRHRLPAIYPFRYFVVQGGLVSYGIDIIDVYRRAAAYVDRILRGEKPADLPAQGPVKFELAINLNTAKSIGLEIPPTLLSRADDVIE